MSVKEKARAYDEALEIARQYWNDKAMPIGTNFKLERMFPELKEESEDERIRKWIKKEFESKYVVDNIVSDVMADKALAWLEKQGKPADINPSEFELRLNKLLKQFESLSKEDLADILSFYLNVVQNNEINKANEKQVEQKPYGQRKECVGCQFNYAGECKGYCDLKRNELANEDEPKFKVGDWIIDNNIKTPFLITGISNEKYDVISIYGNDMAFSFHEVEHFYHLWTIQDAKDGDVLCCESGWTCIFKSLNDGDTFSSYCFMDRTKSFFAAGSECHTLKEEFMKAYNGKIYPANKEQRNILMKVMANAGYTFDFEKKELRKIEQKPAESIKEYDFHGIKFVPKFAKGYIIKDKKRGEVSTIEDFSYDTGLYTHTYGQFPITIQDNYEIIEKKPSNKVETKFKDGDWVVYEENIYQIHNISLKKYYECLRTDGTVHTFDSEYIDSKSHLWSIKDAKDGDVLVDEDDNIGICKEIEGNYWDSHIYLGCDGKLRGFSIGGKHEQTDTHPATNKQCDTLMKAMEDAGYTFDFEKKELKKIEQNPTEWSEEDERMIDTIISDLERHGGKENSCYSAEINYLEYLKYRVQPQTKQRWNEDDESWFKEIELMCLNFSNNTDYREKFSTWLKSLKDRVFPLPKQEWSEEDERNASYICAALDCYYRLREDRNNTNGQEDLDKARNWLYNKLRSLNPQNRWISVDKEVYVKEPVLAQKKDKSDQFGGFVVCCDHTLTPNVYERYMILGDIVSQNRWRPSDEEIEALEKVLKYFHMSKARGETIDGLKELLEQLLKQLKSLKEE